MLGKGKLSGSPFHVENQFYKYAIENETSDCRFSTNALNCEYCNLTSEICMLYNSGMKKCCPFKCKYLHHELRRKNTCTQCAYFFRGECRNAKCKGNKNIEVASYCCCFNNDEKKYSSIQKKIELELISLEIAEIQKTIAHKEKYNRKAMYKISNSTNQKDIDLCQSKIDLNLLMINSKQNELQKLQKRFSELSK